MNSSAGKKALFIIAHELFRDEEYEIPREALETECINVSIASSDLTPATGKNGLKVTPDLLINDADEADYDVIVFVGGAACKEFWHDAEVHNLARKFIDEGKLTTAICSAPVILANAGLLRNRHATCYPNDKEELARQGALYSSEDVVIDGQIITAAGYWASAAFAKAIIAALKRKYIR